MQSDDYIRFRLPADLKELFYTACKYDYKSVSEVLRDAVVSYVRKSKSEHNSEK
jgi:hypothetical protein